MKPSIEDIQWLRILDLNVPGDIPEFNKSRLIALGFAVREGDSIRVTERGKAMLAANPGTTRTT